MENYTTIQGRGEAQDPAPEDVQPIIHRGIRDPVCSVLPPGAPIAAAQQRRQFFLMRQDNPQFSYIRTEKVIKEINHHGAGWGIIIVGVLFHRVPLTVEGENHQDYLFQIPTESDAELVTIKILRKEVVQRYLDRGGHENPYMEIVRMQQLGDDIHVLSCVEALEDNKYIYIITPYCRDGSLKDNILWAACKQGNDEDDRPGFPEEEARRLFKQILQILQYLEHHGICHHDLSPDNFMFFNGRLVLIDFAMSLRIPRNAQTRERYLIKGQGRYGTMAYQSPELFAETVPFDGCYADLWSSAIILYNMLTGYTLYHFPYPTDIIFQFFIMAGGLTRDSHNERTIEILRDTYCRADAREGKTMRAALAQIAQANLDISEEAKELFEELLALNPHNRCTLQEAIESDWVLEDDEYDED